MHPWAGAFPRWLTRYLCRVNPPSGPAPRARRDLFGLARLTYLGKPTRASGSWNGWPGGWRRRSSSSPGSRCDTSGPRSGGPCGSQNRERASLGGSNPRARSPARGLDRASRPPQARPALHPGCSRPLGGLVRGERPAQAPSTAGPGTAGAGSRCSARARARLRRGGGVGRADRTVDLVVAEKGRAGRSALWMVPRRYGGVWRLSTGWRSERGTGGCARREGRDLRPRRFVRLASQRYVRVPG